MLGYILYKSLLIKIVKYLIKYSRLIIGTNNNLILFGAMNGNYYGDNSKYLFEWILKHEKRIKCVWVTRDYDVFHQMKKNGLPAVLMNSIKAVFALCRAKVAVFTNSQRDLALDPCLLPNSLHLIALRHGRSVKRVRFARKKHKISSDESESRRREGNLIKYAISTSEMISDIQEECLCIGRNKHKVTGYPRNDNIMNFADNNKQKWNSDFINFSNYDKIILYGPSWRHGRKPTKFFPFDDFKSTELIDYLEINNVLMLLRPHVNDFNYFLQHNPHCLQLLESKNIKTATHKEFPDVNYLLPFVDILISDYSALYHDYLLLNRPIIFFPYDYDDFESLNGFLYDYYKNLPGPAIYTFLTFIQELKKLFSNIDDYKKSRIMLRNKIHRYRDSNSSARVYKLIEPMLKN